MPIIRAPLSVVEMEKQRDMSVSSSKLETEGIMTLSSWGNIFRIIIFIHKNCVWIMQMYLFLLKYYSMISEMVYKNECDFGENFIWTLGKKI